MPKITPIAVFVADPGWQPVAPLENVVYQYTVALYKSGISVHPHVKGGSPDCSPGILAQFANLCDVFTRVWSEYSDSRGFIREMQRCGYIGRAVEYVREDENENSWDSSNYTLNP